MYWRRPLFSWLPLMIVSVALFAVNASAKSHRVSKGESLWGLARQYGVSVEALQAANKLGASSQIRAGQTLSIPSVKRSQKAKATSTKTSEASANSARIEDARKPAKPAKPTKPGEPTKPTSTSAKATTSTKVEASHAPIDARMREKAERLYSRSAPKAGPDTLSEQAPAWVLAEPGRLTQGEKPSAGRGGVFPCAAPDPGFGDYAKWVQVAPMAHVLAPPAGPKFQAVHSNAGFDVLFHFHGREPIRKEWVRAMNDRGNAAVLVAIDIGIASESYRETFRDPRTFSQVLLAVEHEIQRRSGNQKAFAENIALSAWSAGYGALEQLLTQPVSQQRVDSVILLDSLHAGFANESLDAIRLSPFVRFAKLAAKEERLMFVSHSSIRTPGYASTTQTTNYLAWKVGGKPHSTTPLASDPMGLDRITSYSKGNFHARGFRGSGASDHCAHLGLMRDVIAVHLQPRWKASRSSEGTDPLRVANND